MARSLQDPTNADKYYFIMKQSTLSDSSHTYEDWVKESIADAVNYSRKWGWREHGERNEFAFIISMHQFVPYIMADDLKISGLIWNGNFPKLFISLGNCNMIYSKSHSLSELIICIIDRMC